MPNGKLENFLFKEIDRQHEADSTNPSFDDLLKNKISDYKSIKAKELRAIKYGEMNKSDARFANKTDAEIEDLAYEDVVCDSLAKLLTEKETFVQLTEKIKAKDKGLWQTIKDFISNLLAKFDEIIGEKYANIKADTDAGNAFRNATEEARNKIRDLYTTAFADANENSKASEVQAESNTEPGGDARFFSIRKDINGNTFVQIDENAIDLTNGNSIASNIAAMLKSKFNNLIKINGQLFRVNSKTNKEFRNSDWARSLKEVHPEWHNDKIQALNNIDEIVKVAKGWINENIKHERTDNITSFGKASINYKVKEEGYKAEILVGLKDDGSAIIYDLIKVEPKK